MDMTLPPTTPRYAKCIEVSKRIRWEIDRDVIRGRAFDYGMPFLPDGTPVDLYTLSWDDAVAEVPDGRVPRIEIATL